MRVWTLLKEAAAKWSEHKDARSGAALAYYSVFSIGPVIVIAIAIAGLAFGREAVQGQVTAQLQGLLAPASIPSTALARGNLVGQRQQKIRDRIGYAQPTAVEIVAPPKGDRSHRPCVVAILSPAAEQDFAQDEIVIRASTITRLQF
jgi:hypothetical protein